MYPTVIGSSVMIIAMGEGECLILAMAIDKKKAILVFWRYTFVVVLVVFAVGT